MSSLSRIACSLARAAGLVSPALAAAGAAPDGYHHTGDAVLKANHWPFTIELFAVGHDMRDLPAEKSRQAVIALDTDKRLTLRFLRDMDPDRITRWMENEYAHAGFRDAERVRAVVGAFGADRLAKDEQAVVQYDAATQITTVTVGRGAPIQVKGLDFMRATWAVWFGRALGDGLVAQL